MSCVDLETQMHGEMANARESTGTKVKETRDLLLNRVLMLAGRGCTEVGEASATQY